MTESYGEGRGVTLQTIAGKLLVGHVLRLWGFRFASVPEFPDVGLPIFRALVCVVYSRR